MFVNLKSISANNLKCSFLYWKKIQFETRFFLKLILEEKKKGTTILLCSHILEEVQKTCDRTAILRAGKLVAVEDLSDKRQNLEELFLHFYEEEGEGEK